MSKKNIDPMIEFVDEVTNIIMDFLRDSHGIDPDSDLDDMLYTYVHTYIKRMVHHTTTVIHHS
jgi:hypothetical protein